MYSQVSLGMSSSDIAIFVLKLCYKVIMYITRVPNRGSPPAVLLRESFRENGKVKTRTLANLSRWPEHKLDRLDRALKGLPPADWDLSEAFDITRSLPHGHVAAVLGTAEKLGMPELIDPTPSRRRNLVLAMLIGQIIEPGSKLAIARGLRAQTATSSLGVVLGVAGCDQDDLYAAMDWALERKDDIETALAARHRTNGTLVLSDVSSAAVEGHSCPLGKIGHARDGVKGRLQIVYGLLCSPTGAPVAIEVFNGQHRRPENPASSNRQAQNPIRTIQDRPGGRSGHAHQRAHPRRAAPGAPGLDQRATRPADQGVGRPWCPAAVAVR